MSRLRGDSDREPCRIVIVDDDFTCRGWLRGLVTNIGFSVVGEANNGDEGIEVVKRVRPDVVLLDVSMPVKTGAMALPEIRRACPDAQVIMLTSIADQVTVMDCIDKGASNYLLKDCDAEEIKSALMELKEECGLQESE
jgi:YesN/AraC family two-component response regulator